MKPLSYFLTIHVFLQNLFFGGNTASGSLKTRKAHRVVQSFDKGFSFNPLRSPENGKQLQTIDMKSFTKPNTYEKKNNTRLGNPFAHVMRVKRPICREN